LLSVVLFVCSIPFAIAGYVTGYTDWQDLSSAGKQAFVAGVIDYMAGVSADEPFSISLLRGANDCLISRKITANDLVRDVDRLYGDYNDLRKIGSAAITYLAIVQECESHINKARSAAGLAPLSAATILHNLAKPP